MDSYVLYNDNTGNYYSIGKNEYSPEKQWFSKGEATVINMQLIVWNINHELYNKLCPREAGIESLCRKYLGKKKNIHINDLFSPKHRTKTLKIIRNNQMQTVLLRAHALPGDIAEKLMIDSVSTL